MTAIIPSSPSLHSKRLGAGSARLPLPPFSAGDVSEILRYVPSRPPYDQWVHVIAAVGSVLQPDEAACVLNAWTPEDWPGQYLEKLRSRLKSVGIGSLIHMAKQYGFDASAFTRRRAGQNTTGTTTPPQVPRSLAPVPPPPPKKLPRYSKRLGTAEELATLATLRRFHSPRRPRRDAGRRVPRLH